MLDFFLHSQAFNSLFFFMINIFFFAIVDQVYRVTHEIELKRSELMFNNILDVTQVFHKFWNINYTTNYNQNIMRNETILNVNEKLQLKIRSVFIEHFENFESHNRIKSKCSRSLDSEIAMRICKSLSIIYISNKLRNVRDKNKYKSALEYFHLNIEYIV